MKYKEENRENKIAMITVMLIYIFIGITILQYLS